MMRRQLPFDLKNVLSSCICAALFAGAAAFASEQVEPTVVNIESMQFNPPVLSVKIGQEVEWINHDLVPHTATSNHAFDSRSIAPTKSWKFKFKKKGHFRYKCSFHPTMFGEVDVEPLSH